MTKHGTILLADDDSEDLLLTRKALLEAELPEPVQSVNTCEDAIKYLAGGGVYANRTAYPEPYLVLADLKAPGEDSFKLLRWLYERPGLRKQFTTVLWNASTDKLDIQLAYELGAQSFVQKPAALTQRAECLRRLTQYWTAINLLPGDGI
jgi:CheY-like chemotaxis protein